MKLQKYKIKVHKSVVDGDVVRILADGKGSYQLVCNGNVSSCFGEPMDWRTQLGNYASMIVRNNSLK